jgi:UDP:flavonoid glycosyltransferase YjiC (YdhE family)
MKPARRPRILFVAENVTLAQVVRLFALAKALPEEDYEVHFASSSFDPLVFEGSHFVKHPLFTLDKRKVLGRMDAGKRLYERSELREYVDAELALFDEVEPDLVVGDFRLSLPVSTRQRGVRHAALINAYWSPFARRNGFPVPDHPIVRFLGEEMTAKYFPLAIPKVFAHFVSPVNALRKDFGLAPLGSMLEMLTAGDDTLYLDEPTLVPVDAAPPTHRYLGPVLWAPNVPLPDGLDDADARPLVYVTLGSSGRTDALPHVVAALGRLPVRAVVATAGRLELGSLPENVRAYPFVPGDELSRRARLVISNGGSTTSYQALAEGTPVVGLPSNFDQYLAMTAIENAGAGVLVKARSATSGAVAVAVLRVLTEESFSASAHEIARRFRAMDSGRAFRNFVAGALSSKPPRDSVSSVQGSLQ